MWPFKGKREKLPQVVRTHTVIPVDEILVTIDDTVVKISAISALHYQNGKSMVHIKGGKFIEVTQSRDDHKALVSIYKGKLQLTLPNKQDG